VIGGCLKSPLDDCDAGLYTEDGKCCNHVCDFECPTGYKEGSCNCLCKTGTSDDGDNDLGDDDQDGNIISEDNINEVFGEEEITPPIIPA